ncbi:hypothetical protein ACFFRR_001897 [Megaselia abdita]
MLKWTVNNTCRQNSAVGKINREPNKELHTKTSTPLTKSSSSVHQCPVDSIIDLSKISLAEECETPKKAVYYVSSTLPTFQAEYSPCNFGNSFGILLNFQKPRNINYLV